MTIKKKEFIERMAKKGGITRKSARLGLELFIDTLTDCMREDETVMLARFGRFEAKTLKEKQGRNPQTGKGCFIPEHKKIKFHTSGLLDEKVN